MLFAFEVGCIFRVALAFILRMSREGAQWAAATGGSAPGSFHGIRDRAFFDPVYKLSHICDNILDNGQTGRIVWHPEPCFPIPFIVH